MFDIVGENYEIEAKLIVRSDLPLKIVNSLRQLCSFGPYHLSDKEDFKIRDTYFDTDTLKLKSNHIALRTRMFEDKIKITLKGQSIIKDWGGVQRVELEYIWSLSTLKQILSRIPGFKVTSTVLRQLFQAKQPIQTMEKLGFKVIQDRTTYRRLLNVYQEPAASVLAEFVIDEVHFHSGKNTILKHFEVEIEAKSEEGITALKTILKELQTKYPDDLRIWPYSKLETGKAIQESFTGQQREFLIDDGQCILPAGYDMIDSYIKTNK